MVFVVILLPPGAQGEHSLQLHSWMLCTIFYFADYTQKIGCRCMPWWGVDSTRSTLLTVAVPEDPTDVPSRSNKMQLPARAWYERTPCTLWHRGCIQRGSTKRTSILSRCSCLSFSSCISISSFVALVTSRDASGHVPTCISTWSWYTCAYSSKLSAACLPTCLHDHGTVQRNATQRNTEHHHSDPMPSMDSTRLDILKQWRDET